MQVAGVPLRVRRVGSGRKLLLVNGIGCSLETWRPLERELKGFELLSFDPPGVGGSPPGGRPLGIPEVSELALAVTAQAGWRRFDVLGLSWGGTVAQQLAHDHPERVRRLVLCATTFGPGAYCIDPLTIALMATPLRHRSRAFMRTAAPYLYGSDVREFPEAFTAFVQDRRPVTLRGFYAQALAATLWTSLPWLRTLPQPTLVMAGRKDRIVPLFVQRMLARLIPGAALHASAGGHLFLLLRTRESAAVIRSFLRGSEAGRRRAAEPEEVAS